MSKGRAASRFQRLRGEARTRAVGEVLARWRAAGTSKAAFCRAEGIASVTLSRWLAEFGGHQRPGPLPARFVDVVLGDAGTGSPAPFHATLPGGVRLRIPAGFDTHDLTRLLLALAAC